MEDGDILPFEMPGDEPDQIDDILAVLHGLVRRASSPVIQACLEDAIEEILHFADRIETAGDSDADADTAAA